MLLTKSKQKFATIRSIMELYYNTALRGDLFEKNN